MLIGMLIALAIVGLLYAGPSFDNTLVAIAVYGGIILGMILAWWYMHNLSGGLADFMLGGGGGGKAKASFDQAERCEAEQRYDEAIEIYKRAIEKTPKDPEPRKRLANVYHTLHDYDNCIKYMLEALSLSKSMDEAERCTLMNRIADLYLQHKGDRASAARMLMRIVKEFPKSKYAVYARERIVHIKRGG
jgi:tetratricopeptide (TPR) repeat protein